ncbi:hypothetical protein EMGBS1_04130 [Chloroflexota bacterium]|nr:hypothetical protein EMGBS1_04130 [Chloroflexota bacterium]
MLAYQPVGPNVQRFVELTRAFPATRFSVIADDVSVMRTLSAALTAAGATAEVLLDVDCGMHRTGIAAGTQAFAIYKELATLPGITPGGLHAYDGHNNLIDITARTAQCAQDMAPVRQLRGDLQAAGLPVPRLVSSGTRTFPIHAANSDVECSPGTTVLSDTGTAQFPDLNFQHAALVFTRVISNRETISSVWIWDIKPLPRKTRIRASPCWDLKMHKPFSKRRTPRLGNAARSQLQSGRLPVRHSTPHLPDRCAVHVCRDRGKSARHNHLAYLRARPQNHHLTNKATTWFMKRCSPANN